MVKIGDQAIGDICRGAGQSGEPLSDFHPRYRAAKPAHQEIANVVIGGP